MGAALFHTGLSPAVTPSTPLNGACHSAGARRDLTGQERREERGEGGEKKKRGTEGGEGRGEREREK